MSFLTSYFLVNYASVMGLLTDTNMHTDQFSNLTLAFYVTYLFFELPTGFLMQRLPTAKYLGLNGEPRQEREFKI
jgi:fucose permease